MDQRIIITATAGVSALAGAFVGFTVANKRAKKAFDALMLEETREIRKYYERNAKPVVSPVEMVEELGISDTEVVGPPPTLDEAVEAVKSYDTVTPQDAVVRNVFDSEEPFVWNQVAEESKRASLPLGAAYVISEEEYLENDPDHTQEAVTYFEVDDVFADEQEEHIQSPGQLFPGDVVDRFGHGTDLANKVYVRNPALKSDYEITRSGGSYSVEVLGLDPTPSQMLRSRRGID